MSPIQVSRGVLLPPSWIPCSDKSTRREENTTPLSLSVYEHASQTAIMRTIYFIPFYVYCLLLKILQKNSLNKESVLIRGESSYNKPAVTPT